MVDWLDLGRSVIFDLLRLAFFWATEKGKGKTWSDSCPDPSLGTLGAQCLDHISRHLSCVKEKGAAESALAECQEWGVAIPVPVFLCWWLGLLTCFLTWLIGVWLTRSTILVGEPVQIEIPKVYPIPEYLDGFELSFEDDEVVAARRRARALRG